MKQKITGSFKTFTLTMNNEPSTVVLTFDSIEENVWCDYSNKSFLAVLVQGGICFLPL